MPQTVGRSSVTLGYRIRRGNAVALVVMPYRATNIASGEVRVVYDDGTEDDLYFDPSPTTTIGTSFLSTTKQAARDGWIVGGAAGLVLTGSAAFSVRGYGQILIVQDVLASRTIECIGQGPIGVFQVIAVGQFTPPTFAEGVTWVFRGTVAEDATVGTHVSSLAVTPGAGNEITILYGRFVAGAGAANITSVAVDDGAGNITVLVDALSLASGAAIYFPFTGLQATGTVFNVASPIIVSGTMRFVMQTSTATVSLTHTFAVAARLKPGSALPTATLADSVGTPTLTTNTNAVFG